MEHVYQQTIVANIFHLHFCRSCQQNVTLFNPLDEEVSFSYQITNAKHFVVSGLSEGEVGSTFILHVPHFTL